jgi:hypothetical protein
MIYMNLVTGIIAMLQLFGQPVPADGNCGRRAYRTADTPHLYISGTCVSADICKSAFRLRLGYGLVIFTVIMLLTIVVDKTSKYWVNNEMN